MNHILIDNEEFEREWMELRIVSEVSGGVPTKNIRNWTDRDYIQISNRNPGTNEKRLYSLKHAIEISAISLLTMDKKPAPTAKILAEKIVNYAAGIFAAGRSIDDLQQSYRVLVYFGTPGQKDFKAVVCEPSEIPKWLEKPYETKMTKLLGFGPMNFQIFHIDYLIQRCCETYEDQLERAK